MTVPAGGARPRFLPNMDGSRRIDRPAKLDAHGRFSATADIGADVDGAAVRVSHPSTGIHYYVRHLAR